MDTPKNNNMVMGILAYIGPLVIIPYITTKNNPFVTFHIKQGLVLLVIEIVLWIVGMVAWMLWPLIDIVHLGMIILSIIGIINVTENKEKELPVVGQFSKHFRI